MELISVDLAAVRESPKDDGRVELLVRRPAEEEREVLEEGQLDLTEGLVGDNWSIRGSKSTPDGSAHPDAQITMMNARAAAMIAGDREHWPLAGDQLFVDLDLSGANLPPGTRLSIGSAVLEITDKPHTGCGKFLRRFGLEAQKLVNSPPGRELNLRGVNARVVTPGTVRVGDSITRI